MKKLLLLVAILTVACQKDYEDDVLISEVKSELSDDYFINKSNEASKSQNNLRVYNPLGFINGRRITPNDGGRYKNDLMTIREYEDYNVILIGYVGNDETIPTWTVLRGVIWDDRVRVVADHLGIGLYIPFREDVLSNGGEDQVPVGVSVSEDIPFDLGEYVPHMTVWWEGEEYTFPVLVEFRSNHIDIPLLCRWELHHPNGHIIYGNKFTITNKSPFIGTSPFFGWSQDRSSYGFVWTITPGEGNFMKIQYRENGEGDWMDYSDEQISEWYSGSQIITGQYFDWRTDIESVQTRALILDPEGNIINKGVSRKFYFDNPYRRD